MKSEKWLLTLFVFLSFISIECKKDKPKPTLIKFVGDGSGAQVVPKVITGATSNFMGEYSGSLHGLFTYTITYKNLSGPYTRISVNGPADRGINGPEVNVPPGGSTVNGYFTIDSIQEKQLMSGQWYYLIRTEAHPDGEVRGQIVKE